MTTFLPNSVFMCGSDGEIRDLEEGDKVYVYDNEHPKKLSVSIGRVIERGGKVVIWPSNVKEKDLNDMVLLGTQSPIELVKSNVYSGLEKAFKLKFTTWKKRYE